MCLHACGCHYRWSAGHRHHRLCRFLGSKKSACARKGKTIEPSPFDKINQLLRGKTSLLYMCSSFYVLDCFSLSSAISCIARQNFDWHRDWWWMRVQRLGSIDWMAQTTQQIYTRRTRKNDYTNATKTKCIDGDNDIKWLLWSISRKAGAHQERQCFGSQYIDLLCVPANIRVEFTCTIEHQPINQHFTLLFKYFDFNFIRIHFYRNFLISFLFIRNRTKDTMWLKKAKQRERKKKLNSNER